LAKSIDDALSDFELPVLKARTSLRVAYEEAGGAGLTVLDLESRDKASAEIEAITSELLEMLDHAKV
jgi:cellulose biosynthesis protein BcsQ